MDAHPDPSSSPTEPLQLLSAKFLRKSKLRKEDLSNEHAEVPIVENLEMITNATYIEMKEKLEPATTVAAARNTSDTVLTTLAAQTSSSPLPDAPGATPISEENEIPNNIAHSSPEGISTVTSGTFDATKFLAQSNTLSSSSPVSLISSLPTNLKSRIDTLESSFARRYFYLMPSLWILIILCSLSRRARPCKDTGARSPGLGR
jgi:hypothetical protein